MVRFLLTLFRSAPSTISRFICLVPTIACIAVVHVVRHALETSSGRALWRARRCLSISVLFATSYYNKEPYLLWSASAPYNVLNIFNFIPHFSAAILFIVITNCITFDRRYFACETKMNLRSIMTLRYLHCFTYFMFQSFILMMGILLSFMLSLTIMATVLEADIFNL